MELTNNLQEGFLSEQTIASFSSKVGKFEVKERTYDLDKLTSPDHEPVELMGLRIVKPQDETSPHISFYFVVVVTYNASGQKFEQEMVSTFKDKNRAVVLARNMWVLANSNHV